MLDTKEKPVEGKVTEPAKQWRNWWKALEDGCIVEETRERLKTGALVCSAGVYPSKEVAEQKAADGLAYLQKRYGRTNHCEYLGAFPVTP